MEIRHTHSQVLMVAASDGNTAHTLASVCASLNGQKSVLNNWVLELEWVSFKKKANEKPVLLRLHFYQGEIKK